MTIEEFIEDLRTQISEGKYTIDRREVLRNLEEELEGALVIPKGWYLKEGDWRIREYKRATHTESKDDGRLSRYTVSLYNDNNQQVKGESDWFDAWSESGRKYSTQALRNALEQIKTR